MSILKAGLGRILRADSLTVRQSNGRTIRGDDALLFGECGSPPLTRGDAGHTSRIWLVSGRDKTFGLDYQYLKFVHGSTSYEQVVQPSRPLYTSCRRISSRFH